MAPIEYLDFAQYWSAAKLILAGQNPYDTQNIFNLEQTITSLSAPIQSPVIMWNPPLVILFIIWLGFFNFSTASTLWFVLSCIGIASSIYIILSTQEIKINTKIVLAIVSFQSIMTMFFWGQITFIPLFGLSLFYYGIKRNAHLLAGIALSFTLIKPHLLYLFYLSLFIALPYRTYKKFWLGLIGGFLLLALAPLAIYSHVWLDWFNKIDAPPLYWQTPTIGSFLQGYIGVDVHWVRYLPSFIVLAIFLSTYTRPFWKDSLALIPLSLVTSPYGWLYDQALLLPTIFMLVSSGPIVIWLSALVLSAITLLPTVTEQQYFVWYPACIFALALLERFKYSASKH